MLAALASCCLSTGICSRTGPNSWYENSRPGSPKVGATAGSLENVVEGLADECASLAIRRHVKVSDGSENKTNHHRHPVYQQPPPPGIELEEQWGKAIPYGEVDKYGPGGQLIGWVTPPGKHKL